jgi:tol-pal system protein YbgF
MRKFFLLNSLIVFFAVLMFACTTPIQKKKPQTISSRDSTSDQKIESWQNQIQLLEQKLNLLNNRIGSLIEQQKQDKEAYEKTIAANRKTIGLLELNLKGTNKKIDDLKAAQTSFTKPPKNVNKTQLKSKNPPNLKSTVVSEGLVKEMKTSDKSAAVEEIILLKSKAATKEKSASAKGKGSNSISVPKNKKDKSTEVGIETLKWEDPDLRSPVSPIKPEMVPGAKRRYQSAFKVFSEREYEKSIKLFEDFIMRFPNDQDADNSQFWIGQAYYELGNYLQAEMAFRKVLKNYGHGETKRGYKTPDAVLMLGRLYIVRDMPIKAISYFNYILANYSNSRSAVKAKREKQALNSF